MLAYRTHCAAMSFFFKSQGSSWSHRFTEFIHAKFSTGISGDLLAQDPLHFLFNIFSRTRKILVRTDSQILYLFFDPRSQVQAICWPGTNCNDYPHQIQIQTQVQIKIKIQMHKYTITNTNRIRHNTNSQTHRQCRRYAGLGPTAVTAAWCPMSTFHCVLFLGRLIKTSFNHRRSLLKATFCFHLLLI